MKYKITAERHKLPADLQTPVGIYLKVRDLYPQSVLLESSDYHSSNNSFSYIGIEPIARFSVKDGNVEMQYPDGAFVLKKITSTESLSEIFQDFLDRFDITGETGAVNGLFGFTAYDTVKYFESIPISEQSENSTKIPDMNYLLYRFIIAINHLCDEMSITENLTEGKTVKTDEIIAIINSRNFPSYHFSAQGERSSSVSDDEFRAMIRKGIEHCRRGDVFQIVLSRRFEQAFQGDDFNVYRALRSINPSPYLFYFDFGSYRIFGSSPETHLKIEGDKVTIDPIAGTFPRTGNDEKDQESANRLREDPKENAEHVMLVDLARNDLSRNARKVEVKHYKEIQFYSHVIHMVSRVSGNIAANANRIKVFADTFPAGTLSGAPKVRAMQLINEIEQNPRGIYGGCIGHIGFNGDINQAITIRTFVSRDNTLYFQAGAGIVSKSNQDNELQEVNNKLGALNRAIQIANKF